FPQPILKSYSVKWCALYSRLCAHMSEHLSGRPNLVCRELCTRIQKVFAHVEFRWSPKALEVLAGLVKHLTETLELDEIRPGFPSSSTSDHDDRDGCLSALTKDHADAGGTLGDACQLACIIKALLVRVRDVCKWSDTPHLSLAALSLLDALRILFGAGPSEDALAGLFRTFGAEMGFLLLDDMWKRFGRMNEQGKLELLWDTVENDVQNLIHQPIPFGLRKELVAFLSDASQCVIKSVAERADEILHASPDNRYLLSCASASPPLPPTRKTLGEKQAQSQPRSASKSRPRLVWNYRKRRRSKKGSAKEEKSPSPKEEEPPFGAECVESMSLPLQPSRVNVAPEQLQHQRKRFLSRYMEETRNEEENVPSKIQILSPHPSGLSPQSHHASKKHRILSAYQMEMDNVPGSPPSLGHW
ncbi:unnamed protein product, partial [Darwinula stevensoni]